MSEQNEATHVDKSWWNQLRPFFVRWKWLILGMGIVLLFGILYWLVATPSLPTWTNFNDKGLWDVLDLIIVPLALAVVAYFFNRREKETELEIARKERESEQRIAQKERESEQQIARDRDEEQALQTYFGEMSKLLLEHQLRESKEDSEQRSIARSRTLTTLRRLNSERKAALVLFLYESKLISHNAAVISLLNANLSEITLESARLVNAHLEGAHLIDAHLTGAHLEGAHLGDAHLVRAHLEGAHLEGAHLEGAHLEGAHLEGAHLVDAHLVGAYLEGAHLERAHLEGAYLGDAHLERAHLEGANLMGANLARANLARAHLMGANLMGIIYDASTVWPTGFTPPESAKDITYKRAK
jgi:uncharacterized protein YjbI with pentapeptide repeats